MAGDRLTPEQAYRFALGEEVVSSTGVPVRLSRPMDFLVFTDHAEGLGLMTLVLDAAKGAVPVLVADALDLFPALNPAFDRNATIAAAVGAVFGHVFPVTLGFRGGKGVATALGAIAALAPASLPLPLLAFGVSFGLTKRVSVGSICAAMAAPFGSVVAGYPPQVSAAIAILSCVILYRHRDNMERIRAGTEPRFGDRSDAG